MVYTTYLWWFGGWFIIFLATLMLYTVYDIDEEIETSASEKRFFSIKKDGCRQSFHRDQSANYGESLLMEGWPHGKLQKDSNVFRGWHLDDVFPLVSPSFPGFQLFFFFAEAFLLHHSDISHMPLICPWLWKWPSCQWGIPGGGPQYHPFRSRVQSQSRRESERIWIQVDLIIAPFLDLFFGGADGWDLADSMVTPRWSPQDLWPLARTWSSKEPSQWKTPAEQRRTPWIRHDAAMIRALKWAWCRSFSFFV